MCQIVRVAAAQVDRQRCHPLHLPSMAVPSARSLQLQSAHRVSVQVKLEGALASSHIERHMRWRGGRAYQGVVAGITSHLGCYRRS
jgi:hypothetical protein